MQTVGRVFCTRTDWNWHGTFKATFGHQCTSHASDASWCIYMQLQNKLTPDHWLTTSTCRPLTGSRDCMAIVLFPEDCVPTYELILKKSMSRSAGTGSIERTRSSHSHTFLPGEQRVWCWCNATLGAGFHRALWQKPTIPCIKRTALLCSNGSESCSRSRHSSYLP